MSSSLRSKIFSGLLWSVIQNWGGKLITLLLFLVLARVLEPHQFGVFAAAMAVLGFVGIFVDQGLSEAIVQRAEITQQQLNAAFVINLGLACLIFAVLWGSAPLIAHYMEITDLVDILRVASFGVLISATCFSQQAMQRRHFQYRWLAVCALVSILLSGTLGVYFALRGLGAWSLVIQSVSAAAINALMLWAKPQWQFSFDFDFKGVRALLSYGLNRLCSNVLEFANTRYIELFLASALGPVALGVYAVGVRVYQALMQALSSAILDVAHNGFSRLAHDRSALVTAYYKAMTVTAAVAVPAFCLLAAIAPEVTIVIFGPKWVDSGDVMRPMALLGAVQVLQFYNGTIFNALGKPTVVLALMIFKTVITFATLWVVRNQTLASIVYAFVCSQLVTTLPGFYLVRRIVGVALRSVLIHIWPFVTGCMAAVIIIALIRTFEVVEHWPAYLKLIAFASAGACTYLGFVALTARSKLTDLLMQLKTCRQQA